MIVTCTKGESIGLHEFIYLVNSFIYEFIYNWICTYNEFMCIKNSYLQWIHLIAMSSDNLTSAVSTIRCGFPCSHVPRVTNELQLDMIKIQHWKLCCTLQRWFIRNRYGMKRIQLAYRHYEGMGVPISGEILSRLRKRSFDGVFPYLYDGTTKEDYKLALSVETSNCSVTFSKFSQPNTTKITTK